MSDVTRILSAIEQGDPQASEQLLPLVYQELRRLAAQKMAPGGLARRCKPRLWWTMLTFGWYVLRRRNSGTVVSTLDVRSPGSWSAFWIRTTE
jgi:ECF sigma factor